MVKRPDGSFEFEEETAAAAGADILPLVLASPLHAGALVLTVAPVFGEASVFVLRWGCIHDAGNDDVRGASHQAVGHSLPRSFWHLNMEFDE